MSRELVIVTGASKGFGRAVALAFCENFYAGNNAGGNRQLDILLVGGRDSNGLHQTVISLNTIMESHTSTARKPLIATVQADFSKSPAKSAVDHVMAALPSSADAYSSIILINNAGTLGKLDKCKEFTETDIMESVAVNMVAPMELTKTILKTFESLLATPNSGKHISIANVSSLAAISPFDCWGLYAATKAAREMYFRTIALEEMPQTQPPATTTPIATAGADVVPPAVRVYNYAPGPLDTDMQRQIREEMPNVPLKEAFFSMHKEGKLVNPIDSARVLVKLIKDAKSGTVAGEHVDYYDLI